MAQVELQGDIVKHALNVAKSTDGYVKILHVANCEHVMGAGVALRLKQQWRSVYSSDLMTPKNTSKMGTSSIAYVQFNIQVHNMYAQAYPGGVTSPNDPIGYYLNRAIRYDALESCLIGVKRLLQPSEVLMYPMFGAGLAGGDWDVIQAIIDSVFKDVDNDRLLVVYK